MDKIGQNMNCLQCSMGCSGKNSPEYPAEGKGSKEFTVTCQLEFCGCIGSLEKAFSHHENCDKTKNKQCLTRMIFAVFCRNLIPFRLNNSPSVSGNGTCKEHKSCSIILEKIIYMTNSPSKTRQNKIIR